MDLSLVPEAERFALTLARVSGLLVVAPLFGERVIPRRFVAGLAAWASFALAGTDARPAPDLAGVALAAATLGEAGFGLLLGFSVRLALFPVEVAAAALAQESGLSLAQNLDPLQGGSGTPLDPILRNLALLAFLSLGGAQTALGLVARSFARVPLGAAGATALSPAALELVPRLIARSCEGALELVLPVIAAGFLASAVIVVLGRALPRWNLLTDALPLRTLAVLLALVVFLPFTVRAVALGLAPLSL